MARHWSCNKCAEPFETMELAQACHPGADVIGPLRARRVRVRQGAPGHLRAEPDPERDVLAPRVAELEAALRRVKRMETALKKLGRDMLTNPSKGQAYKKIPDWLDDIARALAPSAEEGGE